MITNSRTPEAIIYQSYWKILHQSGWTEWVQLVEVSANLFEIFAGLSSSSSVIFWLRTTQPSQPDSEVSGATAEPVLSSFL